MRRYWNERHAARTWNDTPAEFLAEQQKLLLRLGHGRALDVACGGGRNAFFLAELGFEVDAIDISDTAIERVRRIAAERGAPVRAFRADLAVGTPLPRTPYDVVIDFFYLERPLLQSLSEALAPGGVLLFQTFVGGRFGLGPGELARAFPTFETVHYDEVEIGGRNTARLAAQREYPAVVSGRRRERRVERCG